MKSLVTGAAGFIGSHLTDFLLDQGHKVVGIDNLSSGNVRNLDNAIKNDNFNLEIIDISKLEQLDSLSGPFDFVFHLAALAEIVPSIQNPNAYFQSNVIGTYNICQKAREFEVKKLVYTASSSCYGIPNILPTSEKSELSPQYPYALTKYLGEQVVLHWSRVYQLPSNSLRLFNVYGPRARTTGSYGAVMGVFLAQMLNNKPLTIVGDGSQKRDFTFVSDVVSALFSVANSNKSSEIYNVGSGNPRSVMDLARMIGGKNFAFVPKRPGEPEQTFADISKIMRDLGWKPNVSLEEGISLILHSKHHWKDAPIWTPDLIAEATSDWFKHLGSENV